nr:MAG TPA: Protein of unknown function (DUF3079) [Caudoviricetes sp.]
MLVGGACWGCDLRLCIMAWVTISLFVRPPSRWRLKKVNMPS